MKTHVALLLVMSIVLVPAWARTGEQDGDEPGAAVYTESRMRVDTAAPHTRNLIQLKGTLKDRQGKHLGGVVGVLFAIYADFQSGPALWQEVQNVEAGPQGEFAVDLGASGNDVILADVLKGGRPGWLGVQVLLPGEVEQPRLRVIRTSSGLTAQRASTSSLLREQTLSRLQQATEDRPPPKSQAASDKSRQSGRRPRVQR